MNISWKKNHLKRCSQHAAISFDVRSSLHEFLLTNFLCMTHKSKHSWWPKDPEKKQREKLFGAEIVILFLLLCEGQMRTNN